jgi:hypothetical protein
MVRCRPTERRAGPAAADAEYGVPSPTLADSRLVGNSESGHRDLAGSALASPVRSDSSRRRTEADRIPSERPWRRAARGYEIDSPNSDPTFDP